MSDAIKKIQEYILYQEQSSRTTLSALSTSAFEEVDGLLADLSPNDYNSVNEYCSNQLQKNKNSVYALYISGILALEENTLNDDLLIKLLNIFTDNHKWSVVEFLSNKILEFRNNLQALRRLVMVYEVSDRHKELIPIWEKIVRIDYEEADMLVKLAKIKQDAGDIEVAIKDYKKAIYRYLHQKQFAHIREIWIILISYNPIDIEFYLSYVNKLERILTVGRAEDLLELLYNKLKNKDTKEYEYMINILKNLLRLAPESDDYREYLVDTYRKKHKNNPKLEDFIRMSNLEQSWRNVYEAISDFEKHISFFPGSFVYHNEWGIGRIEEISHQYLTINFAQKRKHQMEISMAVNSLETLPKNHFWVLRSIITKEKLKTQIIENPLWGLKNIIISLNGADIKTIKNELVPSILTTAEWNSWSVKARKILQNNSHFGSQRDKSDYYIYSSTPISSVEKFYDIFRMEDNFLNKIKIMRKALVAKIFEDSVEEDLFLTILDYFTSYVNTINSPEDYNEQFVNSLLVCEETTRFLPSAEYHIHMHLKNLIPNMSDDTVKLIIKVLRINDYKDTFLEYLKKYREDWRELFVLVIPYYHTKDIINTLELEKEIVLLQNIYLHIQKNISDFKIGFIWFSTHLSDREWFKEIVDEFKVASDLLRTGILLYRNIQNKYKVPMNRRQFNYIEEYLFVSGRIDDLIETENHKNVAYLYSLINQISDAMPNRIMNLRDTVLQYHPNFDFKDQFEFEQVGSTGFLTLPQSYDEKKKILHHIHEVEVPANSKEIEKARAYGDLKENAEYKAALEHQEFLNNKVAQLKKEIEQSRIFDKKNINLTSVGFATKINLDNLDDKSTKEYTILGPWESDPDNNIISYLSPLGQKLYKKKLDEKISYTINDVVYHVNVSKITKAIE